MSDRLLLDTPQQQARWIREVFCRQAERLAGDGYADVAFMVIGQGIETMGAFLDKKPFRARGQSAARFARALEEVFPPRYARLNNRDFLFRNLRSSLTHLSIGSPHLVLLAEGETEQHLSVRDKRTVLVLGVLLRDYVAAWERVIEKLGAGDVRVKPLAGAG